MKLAHIDCHWLLLMFICIISLSFMIYTELLPLNLKINFFRNFSIFKVFNSCFIITWSKKF